MDSEVIIIGAGLSGLSAAKWLIEADVSVIVLEASDRVGGRLFTIQSPNVGYLDLGGSYVGPTQDHILRLAKDLGVETYVIKNEEAVLHYQNGRRDLSNGLRINYKNPLAGMEIDYIFCLMDKLSEEVPANAPWEAPHAKEWDIMSFKEFLDKNCWTKEARTYLSNVMAVSMATQPYESSLLNYLTYTKQCGGYKRYMSTENGAQERKFKGGSQQICEKLAVKINNSKGSEVILNSPVVGINQESPECVIVKTIHGKEYKTKNIIMACSPAVQMKVHFTPPLPSLRNQLMQRLPMGATSKCILFYKTAFWRDKGLCGTIFIEGGEEHPMFSVMDDTKPDGSFPALIGFVTCHDCRRLLHLTSDQRKKILAQSLAKVTGFVEFLNPVHYEEKNWMSEPYIGGCYTAAFLPGFFTQYGKALRTPIDRLYFAGTETATCWVGYMNGAVEAGERAAREVLCSMEKITSDQVWIKEPESQDVIAMPFTTSFAEKYTPSVGSMLKFMTVSSVLGLLTLIIALIKKHWF